MGVANSQIFRSIANTPTQDTDYYYLIGGYGNHSLTAKNPYNNFTGDNNSYFWSAKEGGYKYPLKDSGSVIFNGLYSSKGIVTINKTGLYLVSYNIGVYPNFAEFFVVVNNSNDLSVRHVYACTSVHTVSTSGMMYLNEGDKIKVVARYPLGGTGYFHGIHLFSGVSSLPNDFLMLEGGQAQQIVIYGTTLVLTDYYRLFRKMGNSLGYNNEYPGRMYIKEDGYYLISYNIIYTDYSTTDVTVYVSINGSTNHRVLWSVTKERYSTCTTGALFLNKDDYITINIRHTNWGNHNAHHNNNKVLRSDIKSYTTIARIA